MSYRDDRDADQARIAALEQELAEARDKLAALEGRRTQALVLATRGALVHGASPSGAETVFGPGTLRLARQFDGAFPVSRFELLIERIREIAGDPGRTEVLGTSLTWFTSRGDRATGPYRIVTVAVRDGTTTLTITDRLGALRAGIYGGVGGGVGGGGLSLPIMAATYVPMLAPLFLLGWLGGVFFGTRALYQRLVRRRAEEMQQLFDALVGDIDRALRGAALTGA